MAGSTATRDHRENRRHAASAAANTLIDGLTYRNNSDAPHTTNRIVTLTSIHDTGGTANGAAREYGKPFIISTVIVVAVNDARRSPAGPHALTGMDEKHGIQQHAGIHHPDGFDITTQTQAHHPASPIHCRQR